MVQCVEELGTCFKASLLSHAELTHDTDIHCLHARAVHGIATHIAVGVGRRSGESAAD